MARRSGAEAGPHFPNLEPLSSQICGGSSDPFHFVSEPPDVRNWFSSYQYESPETSVLHNDINCLLEEDDSETQDPFGSSGVRRNEHLSVAKDSCSVQSHKLVSHGRSLLPIGDLLSEFYPEAESNRLEKRQPLFQDFDGKLPIKYGNHGDGNVSEDVSRSDGNPFKDGEQSPKRLPGKIKCKLPRLEEIENEVPVEEDSKLRCYVEKSSYVSTRNKEQNTSNGGDIPSKPGSIERHEDPSAEVENKRQTLKRLPEKENYLPENIGLRGTSQHESFSTGSILCLEKKQKLEHEFGVQFLEDSDEDGDRAILSRSSRSLVDDQKCTPQAQPYKSNSKASDEIVQHKQSCHNCQDDGQRKNGGFISTKKKAISTGNDGKVPVLKHMGRLAKNGWVQKGNHENIMENITKLERKEHIIAGKRSALVDRTNIQEGEAAGVGPEIPGDWQHPHKNKPYVGPPLKQLRLERWVHRVN